MKCLALVVGLLAQYTAAKSILGVDLGSLFMKVALVQRNSPLEIVTNLHSKRKTEQMILFDRESRFYGADASSLIGRKPLQVSEAMNMMLGRSDEHPNVMVLEERHYPVRPKYNETRSGVSLHVDGMDFTPEELVAMVLSHAVDITEAFGAPNARDVVLTVPSFYTEHERRALLDASALADLNVLDLIDQTTAAALNYGVDRIDEEPLNMLFYNMGGSSLEVSIIRYHSYIQKRDKYDTKGKKVGSLEILGKGWDATLGGNSFDARLVKYLGEEFNKNSIMDGKDVLSIPRATAKLRVQANKVKHVLSANNDIPVFIDGLYKDTPLSTHVSRSKFEELCHDLLDRSIKPIQDALKSANMTLDDIDQVELIGGGMRIPKVQEKLKAFLGDKLDLGMHINSDESMALGAAFRGANVSTAFRVRNYGLSDLNPFPIEVALESLDGDDEEEEKWTKSTPIFKAFGKLGVKKTIAFTHNKDIHCSLDYSNDPLLPEGTDAQIADFKISGVTAFAKEMADKDLGSPKVSLQFELGFNGLTQLIKAEAVLEETVIVQEEVEVEDEEAEDEDAPKEEESPNNGEDESKAEESKDEKKDTKKKKKMKKVMVDKEKKKVHKRKLNVETIYPGRVKPYSDITMSESKAKLQDLARRDQERMLTEEAKNNLESYIYKIKNKLVDEEEGIAKVTTQEQRELLLKSAEDAEEWLYDDGYNADLKTYKEKYVELSEPAEAVFFRLSESVARPAAIKELRTKLSKVEELMAKWEEILPHVTDEEKQGVLNKVEDVRKWIDEKMTEQEAKDPSETPTFTSAEVPRQTKEIESEVAKLSKKPKPKPEKKEEKEETKSDETEKATNETESSEGSEKSEEAKETEEEL